MVLVTVVGETQCRVGFEFVFSGPNAECRDCKVRNVCFHLEEGRKYRVAQVREVHHECKLHEGGVRVVEVERIPTRAAIPARSAIEGATQTYEESGCAWVGCANYRLCHPCGASAGMKLRVLSVEGAEVECPRGQRLKAVVLD
jgi:uncharacterized protein (UPF0179 family)